MKTFIINCYWEMCGTRTVEAASSSSARDLAMEGSLPTGEFVSGSFEVGDITEEL